MATRDPQGKPAVGVSALGGEDAIYRGRARRLGLPFVAAIAARGEREVEAGAVREAAMVRVGRKDGPAFIAPDEASVPRVRHFLERYPAARSLIIVSTPTAIRAALMRIGAAGFLRQAMARLADIDPLFSAQRVIFPGQVAVGIGLATTLSAALVLWPAETLLAMIVIGTLFFFGVAELRLMAAFSGLRRSGPIDRSVLDDPSALPVYTVLVPLFREAHVVPELVEALRALAWPAERLDIKMIVEADDEATAAAVRHWADGPPFEIVSVPPGEPRTKPRALAYAVTFARGGLVAVFDAEDRPHPYQLVEAYSVFARSDAGLACLQAPIVINNPRASWIARLFALEYSALFDGLLPALARFRLPLPLGGTSNHFRGLR